jgi:hypothetical protein
MEFRTPVIPSPSGASFSLGNSFLTLGSCFADAIGSRLANFKFQTCVNPFGTVYNPVSIGKLLRLVVLQQEMADDTFLSREGSFFNYHLHSSFFASTKPALQTQLKNVATQAKKSLSENSVLIITYGTAWVYERKDTGELVANCHKQPASLFTKRLLTQPEIVEGFNQTLTFLQSVQPTLRIILTLSPVRHLKDTLELNAVSKAVLRTSCYELQQAHASVNYFPAYEIMMDDLRDYRFYKSDMLHPSEDAEEYIWQKFLQAYVDAPTQEFIKKWAAIRQDLNHRAFNPQSAAHQAFLQSLKSKLLPLKDCVNIEAELDLVQSKISGLHQF